MHCYLRNLCRTDTAETPSEDGIAPTLYSFGNWSTDLDQARKSYALGSASRLGCAGIRSTYNQLHIAGEEPVSALASGPRV